MVDNTIALQARAPRMLSYGELMAGRDQEMARRNALAMQQAQMQQNAMAQQKARATEAAMAGATSLVNAGDFAGAEKQYGLGAGNLDVHKAIAGLQDEHRALLQSRFAAAAPVAIQALQEPDLGKRTALIQAAAPMLTQNGWKPEEIAQFQPTDQALTGIINNARTVGDALKQYDKQNEAYTLTPGSARFVGGKQIANVPQLEKVQYLKQPDGSYIPVPVNMSPTGHAPSGGALSVDALRGAIVAQESKGNYGAVSPKGALGAYQLMPPTAKSLAGRLGLPWQPELMTANTPEAKQYQDALGGAAIQEAINASGGDLTTAAKYYHGGSNRAVWGPKTEQYARDIAGRMGGNGGNNVQIGKPVGATKPTDGGAGGKPATVQEQNASYNIGRVIDAANVIQNATRNNPSANAPGLTEAFVGSIPFVKSGVNLTRSEDRQIVAAAQRDLLDGLLYLATGAAYNKEQLEGQMESYIPSYSDKPATVKSKRDRLNSLITKAKTRAGNAWSPALDASLRALTGGGAAPAPAAPRAAAPASASSLPDDVRKKYGL